MRDVVLQTGGATAVQKRQRCLTIILLNGRPVEKALSVYSFSVKSCRDSNPN